MSIMPYESGTGPTSKPAAFVAKRHVVTSAQDSANAAAITVSELSAVTEVIGIEVHSTTGVRRMPQSTVTYATNVVTVTDSGLAVDEVITFIAVGNT